MKKIILWGSAIEYELFYRWIEPELLKGNAEIVGIIINDASGISKQDSFDVIQIEDILNIKYDFIIDMNQNGREYINRIIELLKINREKILPIRIFNLPDFDLYEYSCLLANRVSIIANHCWGGMIYHHIGLPFSSPFINMYVESNVFFDLLSDFKNNMKSDVIYKRMQYDAGAKTEFPVGNLNGVELMFQHYKNFNEASVKWNERKQRINYDNLFIEMTCKTEEDIERFINLPFDNKIAFSYIPVENERIICATDEEINFINNSFYHGNFAWFTCDKALNKTSFVREYNIYKLLLGEKNFYRYK